MRTSSYWPWKQERNLSIDPKKRAALIAKNLAEYAKKNQIEAVIFIDTAARLGAVAFREAWKLLNPKDKIPKTLFLNPYGFQTKEYLSEVKKDYRDSLLAKRLGQMKTGNLIPGGYNNSTGLDPKDSEALERLCRNDPDAETFRQVISDMRHLPDSEALKQLEIFLKNTGLSKNSKILVFDTCKVNGYSLDPIKRLLEMHGAQDVKYCSSNIHDLYTDRVFYLDGIQGRACEAFSSFVRESKIVEKPQDQIHTIYRAPTEVRKAYAQARSSVGNAIRENLSNV